MDMQNNNRAAELEQFLKSRMNSMSYCEMIKDIHVSENSNENTLNVTLVSMNEAVSFDTMKIDLIGVDTGTKWRRKKKDVFSNIKGYHPEISSALSERIRQEADEKLAAWRAEHPFSDRFREFLFSDAATTCFSSNRIAILRFLAGNDELSYAVTEVDTDSITAVYKEALLRVIYDINADRIRFSFSEANSLYIKSAETWKNCLIQKDIESYLKGKGITASVWHTGRPGEFSLLFHFDTGEESERITVGNTYKRIVSGAYRAARERADRKRKEQEDYLKTCPIYGTFLAQAILDTIEDNKNHVTAAQIVDILRGTNLTKEFVFGKYSGKFNLMARAEIKYAIDDLERYDIIRQRCVHGQYQNYYIYSVSSNGKLLTELQNCPVPKRKPVTEQEYHAVLKAVKDDTGKLSERKKLEFLQVIVERPGIFLTDPKLILGCVERMGKTAEEYLKGCYAKEERRTGRNILRLLVNAASGKGKDLPKNGYAAFREREEKKRREKEEAERKDRELFRLVLTEIPDNYVDLYPAARSMERHFVLHIGPTNSGKTHDAIEELMQADNGIYLAPLRLLAYEQYERMNRAECPCTLITGEEQYIIDGARHQSSTIEMLNLRKEYDVAVIDEAQMIADKARGGAWTAAIMGVCASKVHVCAAPEAENRIIEIIKDCGDDYEIIRHRRMTPLVYEDKTFRFPQDVRAGDALIVFSRSNVHAVAAQLKKRNIECSIIYGALPYDVRHKQAELFADGSTKVVVATDAIGMGMNLPIRRVILMETTKFDGFTKRPLRYEEIRQIVGRAGRYGIYDTGYVATANGDRKVKQAIEDRFRPVEKAVIDFPETLLTVDAPILDLIRQWKEVVPAEGWQKESIAQMHRLAEMTKGLDAPKRLAYDFLTIPFEDDNRALLDIWYEAFLKEASGEEYSIRDRVEAIELRTPSSANVIDALEQQHRVLDLYFNFARKFQQRESTLKLIMEKKKDCSDRIMKILETRRFIERRCRLCKKTLRWNYPYSVCTDCYNRQQAGFF